ncbi:MAG: hypothetical protein AABX99_01035, partial [Nanoarchaeota archaeon]
MAKEVLSLNKYKNILSKIHHCAGFYSKLWEQEPQNWRLEILPIIIDEQQDWKECYGLKKDSNGNLIFYKNNGESHDHYKMPIENKISIEKLAKEIQHHAVHADIT